MPNRCDNCGKFGKGPWTRLPVTQADYLFGDADPRYIGTCCGGTPSSRKEEEIG